MTRRLLSGLLLMGISAAVFPLRAEQSAPRDLWPQAVAAATSGDIETAKARTSALIDTGKSFGLRTYPVFAESAAALARQTSKSNAALSDWAAATAQQLDPTSPDVAFTLADRARDLGKWPECLALLGGGYLRIFENYRSLILTRSDNVIVFCFAVGLAAAVLALVLFLRYGRSATHDFREVLGRRLRGGSVTVFAVALLFLPIFLWLGPLWLMFYWFILFFGYASVAERGLIVLMTILLALVPIALDFEANSIAGVDSPIILAAAASRDHAYQPEALRRLQELSALAGENATVSLLLGNMQLHEGSESQAAVQYRKSSELSDTAGVHINLGNLHFLNNDFSAAITEYEKAEQIDPNLAIAYYNHSVASGETYKFDEQGRMIDKAKKIDRSLIDRLLSSPPSQKVVMYQPSMSEAWKLSQQIARKGSARELFGNYSYFDPMVSALNPMTIGALLSLLLAIVLWSKRKHSGFAGSCIKCGRTFCHRCKSARESATYCTQCIHIYLKRDGVSNDTKRFKLDEVHSHQTSMTRRNRLLATFLPGSAQLLEGRTTAGAVALVLFSALLGYALLVGRLAPVFNPGDTARLVTSGVAVLLIVILWVSVSFPVYRRKMIV
jgi:tetratricopeptide (TPR) repeat protein